MNRFILLYLGALLCLCGCKKNSAETISLALDNPSQTTYTLEGAGETVKVKFRSGATWSTSVVYKEGTDWLHLSPETGNAGNQTLSIRADKNDTGTERSATITILSGSEKCSLTIVQPDNTEFIVQQKDFDVPVSGDLIVIDISINRSFTVTPSVDWITPNDDIPPTSDTKMLVYHVAANPGPTERIGYIEIVCGSLTETVTVRQAGEETLEIAPATASFDQNGGPLQVTVTANNTYTVEIDQAAQSWISREEVETDETGRENFLIAANTTSHKRTGTITIRSASGELTKTISVSQDRGPMTLRMMTYNVHNCIGTDEKTDFQRVADVIAAQSPDIVALQELDSVTTRNPVFVLQVLAQKTAMPYYIFGPTLFNYQGGKYGLGILSKEKPISWFQVTIPSENEIRTALFVEFENYYFCSTHFPLNADERTNASAIVCEEAAKLDKPVFLGGDLNASPAEQSIIRLRQHFTMFNNIGEGTYPSAAPTILADYLLGYPIDYSFEILEKEVIAEPVASDHRPFFAVVKF